MFFLVSITNQEGTRPHNPPASTIFWTSNRAICHQEIARRNRRIMLGTIRSNSLYNRSYGYRQGSLAKQYWIRCLQGQIQGDCIQTVQESSHGCYRYGCQ